VHIRGGETAKTIRTGRILAGILIACGFLAALYVIMLAVLGNVFFVYSGLLIVGLCVFPPLTAGTALLTGTMPETDKKQQTVRVYLFSIFTFYILILIMLLFCDGVRQIVYIYDRYGSYADYLKWNSNLVPFKTISSYVSAYINGTINNSAIVANLLGNLLLFAPMGWLLPIVFNTLRTFGRLTLTALVILIGAELLQLLTFIGSFDVDDVILNLIGLLLSYAVWRSEPVQRALHKLYVLK